MKRLRTFVTEHRVAVAIVAAAVIVSAVGMVIIVSGMGGQAVTAPPAVISSAAGPRPTPPTGPTATGGAAGGAAPGGQAAPGQATGAVKSPVAAAAPSNPTPPGTGRPDPFVPLASATAPATATAPALPPVPPLSPTALGPLGVPAPGSGMPGGPALPEPRAQFRLTGIVFGPTAVAILSDGSASYVAEPGDPLARGVRLVAIDGVNDSVTLSLNDQSWQLRLERGTSR